MKIFEWFECALGSIGQFVMRLCKKSSSNSPVLGSPGFSVYKNEFDYDTIKRW